MALLLSVRSLAKSFGPRMLFRGVSFSINDGERIGFIGPNGSGKSTLLKILSGSETSDEGAIDTRRGIRIGYVAQEPQLDEDATILDAIVGSEVESRDHEHQENRRVAASIIIDRIGLTDPSARVGDCSGGMKKRVAIAQQLVGEPDLLLMDEPTNHLDYEGIRWLERTLTASRMATLLISHDRAFLQAVTNRTIELDRVYPDGLLSVDAPYGEFVEKREAFIAAQQGRERAVASRVRREVEWLQRGAKARTTKAKGRIEQAGELKEELAELRTRNAAQSRARIEFDATARQTRKLLQLKSVSKSMGGRLLFKDLSLTLSPGTKLGLLGSNGAGKSTLLKLMTGALDPDSGTVIRADQLKVVVFDQHRAHLDPSLILRRALSPMGDNLVWQGQSMHVTAWASRFLFRAEQLDMPVGQLSGGEQSRALLANLMMMPADVLILDEPTNDLDIPTLDVLEETLEQFVGALVLVTHDRYMLDRLSTELMYLDGQGEARGYAGLWQWEQAQEERTQATAATRSAEKKKTVSTANVTKPTSSAKPRRLSWNEQREWDGMEAAIHSAEVEVQRLEAAANSPDVLADHVKSRAAFEALGAAQTKVATLYERWAELEAKQMPIAERR